MTTRLVLATACVLTHGAHAETTVWTRALDHGATDASQASYARALRDGNEHALQANLCMVSPNERRRQVELALASYKQAASSRPTEGEPHYRTAAVMDAFYVCGNQPPPIDPDDDCQLPTNLCSPTTFTTYGPQLIAEIDAFEARAPLDPRLTVFSGLSSLLFQRAIVRTKLSGLGGNDQRQQLEGAARDYEKIIARSDDRASEEVVSNLAETYMMLDRLDDAIDRYAEADAHGSTEARFGLAVALDRNGQTDRARATMQSLAPDLIDRFHLRVSSKETFFVPLGEEHYYEALIEESRGRDLIALEQWRAYIASNAHPQYQPNARAHIATILKRLAAPRTHVAPEGPGETE